MAGPRTKSVFLERKSYRQRRLRDVARMMPVLGVVLWLLPLAWRGENGDTATTVIYIFAVWLILIGLAALISWRVTPETDAPDLGGR